MCDWSTLSIGYLLIGNVLFEHVRKGRELKRMNLLAAEPSAPF